jgi:16S rRNA G966 N2-methylase RsmD
MDWLLSSVSYPTMNLSLNIAARKEAMKSKEAIQHLQKQQALRYWKIIFQDPPYQPMFG